MISMSLRRPQRIATVRFLEIAVFPCLRAIAARNCGRLVGIGRDQDLPGVRSIVNPGSGPLEPCDHFRAEEAIAVPLAGRHQREFWTDRREKAGNG